MLLSWLLRLIISDDFRNVRKLKFEFEEKNVLISSHLASYDIIEGSTQQQNDNHTDDLVCTETQKWSILLIWQHQRHKHVNRKYGDKNEVTPIKSVKTKWVPL